MSSPAALLDKALPLLLLLLLLLSCRLILKGTLVAIAVILPMALLLPWRGTLPPAGPALALPIAAALVWTWWLYVLKPGRKLFRFESTIAVAVLALGATLAVAGARQSWVLLAAAAVHLSFARPGLGRRRILTALLAVPLAYNLFACGVAAAELGKLGSPGFWWEYWLGSGWASQGWSQAGRSGSLLSVQQLDNLFWLPLILPLAAVASRFAAKWWFAPTFLWCTVLFSGAVLLGRDTVLHFNVLLEMALIVPFGIVGVEKLRERLGRAGLNPPSR